jgi:hypothetical protein
MRRRCAHRIRSRHSHRAWRNDRDHVNRLLGTHDLELTRFVIRIRSRHALRRWAFNRIANAVRTVRQRLVPRVVIKSGRVVRS